MVREDSVLVAGCWLLMRRAGRIMKGFVVVDPDASVVPVSP